MAKFQIFLDNVNQYRWRLKAKNGEIVATSEGYITKQSAEKATRFIKINANGAPTEDLTIAKKLLSDILKKRY